MSGNTLTLGGPFDPESSKPLTWSPSPVRPAQIGQWAADSNVKTAPWGLEGDSDSEMEPEPYSIPKARPPPPPMHVPTASRTITNPLDRSQASSPTPAPVSRTPSRVGKKNCPSRPSSTNLPAAAAAATAALQPPFPPPGPHGSSIFPSLEEYMSRQQSPPRPRTSNQPNQIINEGWADVINQSIDDAQSAEDLIAGAKDRDPTNRHVMTVIPAAIHSLQTQIIGLAEKQASTTSTVSFLADECNRIRVGVTKLQQEAARPQKAPAPALCPPKPQPQPYQQGYAPPPPASLLPGAANLGGLGHISNRTLAQYALEEQEPQQPPRCKTPAPSRVPSIQADDWAEVTGKGKGKAKTFAQAATAGSASQQQQQQAPAAPPTRAKTYPREERDLIVTTGSQADITPTLPKLHGLITDELTKCNNRLALPIGMCQSKKGSIVITTAQRVPASSIKANIEALLPQISALTGSTCRTISERQSGIAFLIHAVPTFERGTTKTQEQHEQEYL